MKTNCPNIFSHSIIDGVCEEFDRELNENKKCIFFTSLDSSTGKTLLIECLPHVYSRCVDISGDRDLDMNANCLNSFAFYLSSLNDFRRSADRSAIYDKFDGRVGSVVETDEVSKIFFDVSFEKSNYISVVVYSTDSDYAAMKSNRKRFCYDEIFAVSFRRHTLSKKTVA